MAADIPQSFVRQYEAEVHEAYQRQGSLLRSTVRLKSNITGKSTTFQKVGKGSAAEKDRHGKVPLMNLAHAPIECILRDFHAGDWVDKFDELKILHDERRVTSNAGAFALGRKTDSLIIEAAGTTTNTTAPGVVLTNGMKVTDATAMMRAFGNADIADDGQRFAIVGWAQWDHLMQIPQFASADFVTGAIFEGKAVRPKQWLGFNWIAMSDSDGGLDQVDADHTTCLFYHMTGIGHASGAEIQTNVDWSGEHHAHFVNNSMSQGSCLIDVNGVYALSFHNTLS